MKKFAVVSGFLGSGKTTLMMALTKLYSEHYAKAAMISNDLGEGVTLADHKLAQLAGCRASQITDECICFCHEVLTERLEACYAEGCELVVSDIPGFGVGAQEHVYHGLTKSCPGQFELAPFTVLIEPHRLALLRGGQAGDMGFILDAQLREADLIVLNKADLLDETERDAALAWLAAHCPWAERLAVSAKTGEGLDALCRALRGGKASLRHPDIDYEADGLQDAMGSLSEYYLQYRALVCCNDFDGSAYLLELAEEIRRKLREGGCDAPHLKLLAWGPDGDYGKADLLGVDRPIELPHRFARPCTDLAVLLNTSAACPDRALNRLIGEAVKAVSDRYQLELTIFKKDHFGLGE
ncbi:MAG: GTP-binding protein [Clostridia bacterium]